MWHFSILNIKQTHKRQFCCKLKRCWIHSYSGREDSRFSSPHWLLITLMSTLVTGEEWCLRSVHTACWHGRCCSRDVLLFFLQPYLMFNITHQQMLKGLQLHLVQIFPDLHIFPSQTFTFHPSPLMILVQDFPWNCNNMLPKIGTMRHIAIFFSGCHLSIWSIWKPNSTLGAIHKLHGLCNETLSFYWDRRKVEKACHSKQTPLLLERSTNLNRWTSLGKLCPSVKIIKFFHMTFFINDSSFNHAGIENCFIIRLLLNLKYPSGIKHAVGVMSPASLLLSTASSGDGFRSNQERLSERLTQLQLQDWLWTVS